MTSTPTEYVANESPPTFRPNPSLRNSSSTTYPLSVAPRVSDTSLYKRTRARSDTDTCDKPSSHPCRTVSSFASLLRLRIHPSESTLSAAASSKESRSASDGVRAGVRAVRDAEQPVPVQGGRTDAGVRGVRGGRGHRVAAGGSSVPVPPPQGTPHHGAPGHRRVPARHQRHPNLV